MAGQRLPHGVLVVLSLRLTDEGGISMLVRQLTMVAVGVLLVVPVSAQEAPQTSWGAPDLQGIWDFRSITPLERPEDLAEQQFLSEEEAANLEQAAVDRIEELASREAERTEVGGNIGAYNDFWMDRGTNTDDTRRTSLIVDPLNGRLPEKTEAGEARSESAPSSFTDKIYGSYTELSNFDRCIMGFNAGPPMTPGAYNNNMQLLQTPDYVAIVTEMVHTARIIPVGDGAASSDAIRQWSGNSRGHWEGDTLVVETEHFNDHEVYANWRSSSKNMKVIERFTRVDTGTLSYEFTVDDQETWTSPWTAQVSMKRNDLPLFEYACHEGNYSMDAMLSGARSDEQGGQ